MLKRRLPWSRFWDRRDFRAFASGDDDVAFVKLEAHNSGDVALRFGHQRLKDFALGREAKAVIKQLAVFRHEGVARLHSLSAATIAAGESSPNCGGRSHRHVHA